MSPKHKSINSLQAILFYKNLTYPSKTNSIYIRPTFRPFHKFIPHFVKTFVTSRRSRVSNRRCPTFIGLPAPTGKVRNPPRSLPEFQWNLEGLVCLALDMAGLAQAFSGRLARSVGKRLLKAKEKMNGSGIAYSIDGLGNDLGKMSKVS